LAQGRHFDLQRLEQSRELLVEFTPHHCDLGNAQARELRARLIGREPRVAVVVFSDRGVHGRIEHGARWWRNIRSAIVWLPIW
jgi:hypothetical protein